MQKTISKAASILTFLIAGVLASDPALAEKPSWAGGGKHRKDDSHAGHGGAYFAEQHRVAVRDYYGEQFRAGKCPPGLAKKKNGCMPPGQAKKWEIGRPLSRDVIFYNVPPALVEKLGRPPEGHRYVRVAADILLIAVGTAIVVDAIQDLSRM